MDVPGRGGTRELDFGNIETSYLKQIVSFKYAFASSRELKSPITATISP